MVDVVMQRFNSADNQFKHLLLMTTVLTEAVADVYRQMVRY